MAYKLRVLQVLPTLGVGGAEGFIANLGVSLASQGADVRFYLLAGVRAERGQLLMQRLQNAGVKVLGAKERNIRSPMNLFRLIWLLICWRPNIVQANLLSTEIVCAVVKLLTPWNSSLWVRRLATSKLDDPSRIRFLKLGEKVFDLTIACSVPVEAAYRNVAKRYLRGTLITVPNGGLLQKTAPTANEKTEARRTIGLSENVAFVVSHIGRMSGGGRNDLTLAAEPKAQDILLKSFARAFASDSTKALILLGDGPLRPKVELLARELGIEAQTYFLGQQSEPWLALRAADVFCFPSRWEGLPNVLPEAASCDLPVVASNIQEIRELHPGNAWVLQAVDDVDGFANALREVSANLGIYKDRAATVAPAFRARFSMGTCARNYMEAYRAGLARKKKV